MQVNICESQLCANAQTKEHKYQYGVPTRINIDKHLELVVAVQVVIAAEVAAAARRAA